MSRAPVAVDEITIRISDILNAEQQAQLGRALGHEAGQDLRPVLENLAIAALSEYRDAFLIDGIPTRADDFQQRRLLQLILRVFEELPNERRVATLFKIRISTARNLLTTVAIRFADRVRAKVEDDIKRALRNNAEGTEGYREIFIRSATTRQAIDDLVDELNSAKPHGPYLDKLVRHPSIPSRYLIPEATLAALKAYLAI